VTSSLGPKAAPALITVREASKHIIQIVQLLEERSMSFAFCLNKSDLLILCGMALLYQSVDLKQDSKVLKDNEKLVNAVIKVVDKARAPGSYDFRRVAGMLIAVDEPSPQSLPTPPRKHSDACIAPPQHRTSPGVATKGRAAIARHPNGSISETDLLLQQEKLRRMTIPGHHPQPQHPSRSSFDGSRPNLSLSQRDHSSSLTHAQAAQAAQAALIARASSTRSQPASPVQMRQNAQQQQFYTQKGMSSADWEALIGSLEGGPGQINVYDAIYGGPGLDSIGSVTSAASNTSEAAASALTPTTSATGWSPPAAGPGSEVNWDLSGFNLGDFGAGAQAGQHSSTAGTAHSVLSFGSAEDGLSDDLTGPTDLLGFPTTRLDGMPVGIGNNGHHHGYHGVLDGLTSFL